MSVPSQIGDVIDGRYRLEKLAGRGGMGRVFEGHHILVGRKVAIKLLCSDVATEAIEVRRFYREAQAAAAISHRGIVEILDVGFTEHEEPYIVMECLEGENLGALIHKSGPLKLPAARFVLEQLLSALCAVHDKGVVHRDLKPENIFVVSGGEGLPPVIKLIDFGVSKLTQGVAATSLTVPGTVIGTPAYMAPEQLGAESDVGSKADIYAAGVILFEMLTGELPYVASSIRELVFKVATEPPRSPWLITSSFPEGVFPVIERAMAKSCSDRYPSAREMLEAVKAMPGEASSDEIESRFESLVEKHCVIGDLGAGLISTDSREYEDISSCGRRPNNSGLLSKHPITRKISNWPQSEMSEEALDSTAVRGDKRVVNPSVETGLDVENTIRLKRGTGETPRLSFTIFIIVAAVLLIGASIFAWIMLSPGL